MYLCIGNLAKQLCTNHLPSPNRPPFSGILRQCSIPSTHLFTKAKKHELFRKRAGIEPVIGHCKSDHRLGRNYYKGLFGDFINVMIAAATFNFKRAMRALFCLFQEVLSGWIKPFIRLKNLYVWQVPSCYADMRTRELAF